MNCAEGRFGSAQAHYDQGKAFLAAGDLPAAVRELQHAATLKPASAPVHYRLGEAMLRSSDAFGAIRPLTEAVNLDPQNPKTHALLGRALLRDGRLSDAQSHLEAAGALDTDDYGVQRDRGELYSLMGEHENAVACLQNVVDQVPSDPVARKLLAQAKARGGREAIRGAGYEEEVLFYTPAKMGTYSGTLSVTDLRVVFEADESTASGSWRPSASGGLAGLAAGLIAGAVTELGAAAFNNVRNANRPGASIPLSEIVSVSAVAGGLGIGQAVLIRSRLGGREYKFSVGKDVHGLIHLIQSRLSLEKY